MAIVVMELIIPVMKGLKQFIAAATIIIIMIIIIIILRLILIRVHSSLKR